MAAFGITRCPRTGEYWQITPMGLAPTGNFSTNKELQWCPDIATFMKFLADVKKVATVDSFEYRPTGGWIKCGERELSVTDYVLLSWLKAQNEAERFAAIGAVLGS